MQGQKGYPPQQWIFRMILSPVLVQHPVSMNPPELQRSDKAFDRVDPRHGVATSHTLQLTKLTRLLETAHRLLHIQVRWASQQILQLDRLLGNREDIDVVSMIARQPQ
jgi:hypothetical protein